MNAPKLFPYGGVVRKAPKRLLAILFLASAGLLCAISWGVYSHGRGPDSEVFSRGLSGSDPGDVAGQDSEAGTARRYDLGSPDGTRSDSDSVRTPAISTQAISAQKSGSKVSITGFVKDLEGRGVAGAVITDVKRPGKGLSKSDQGGGFVFASGGGSQTLTATKPGYKTVMECAVTNGGSSAERTIVMARAISLGGAVRDGNGDPIAGARLWLSPKSDLDSLSNAQLGGELFALNVCSSDENGQFSLGEIPWAPKLLALKVQAQGYEEHGQELPQWDDLGLDIVLKERKPIVVIRGHVLFENGNPASSASVVLGEFNRTLTNVHGEFELPVKILPANAQLIAMLVGVQPAAVEPTPAMLAGEEEIQLVLGGPTLSISGRIQSADGQPLAGWRVGLRTGTVVTHHSVAPRFAEQGDRPDAEFVSNQRGRFQITGLAAHAYDIYARDPESGVLLTASGVRAGTQDLLISVPDNVILPKFHGQVVNAAGVPMPGVKVTATVELPTKTGSLVLSELGSTVTLEQGAYWFEDIPLTHSYISATGGDLFMPVQWKVEPAPDGEPAVLVVNAKCKVQVLVESGDFDAMRIYDGDGNMWPIGLNGPFSAPELVLEPGKTLNVTFPESIRTIALLREGLEVERRAVLIRWREKNTITL